MRGSFACNPGVTSFCQCWPPPFRQILERVTAAEEHAGRHTFVGPNPDHGKEHQHSERHMRKGPHGAAQYAHGIITGGERDTASPDVLPPRHVPRVRDEQPSAK